MLKFEEIGLILQPVLLVAVCRPHGLLDGHVVFSGEPDRLIHQFQLLTHARRPIWPYHLVSSHLLVKEEVLLREKFLAKSRICEHCEVGEEMPGWLPHLSEQPAIAHNAVFFVLALLCLKALRTCTCASFVSSRCCLNAIPCVVMVPV